MQCVFLEVEKKEKEITKTCQAGIGTSAWKPDETTITDWDIMEKIVKINFANLWDLANSDWDKENYVKPPGLEPIMK